MPDVLAEPKEAEQSSGYSNSRSNKRQRCESSPGSPQQPYPKVMDLRSPKRGCIKLELTAVTETKN